MPIRGYAVQAFAVGNTSAGAGQDSPGGAISPRVPLNLNETAYNFGNVSLKARRPALLAVAARGAGRVRCHMQVARCCTQGSRCRAPADSILLLVTGYCRQGVVGKSADNSMKAALCPAERRLAQKSDTERVVQTGGRHLLCARVRHERGGPGERAGLAAHHGRRARRRPVARRGGRHRVRVHGRRRHRGRRHRVLALAHAVRPRSAAAPQGSRSLPAVARTGGRPKSIPLVLQMSVTFLPRGSGSAATLWQMGLGWISATPR